MLLDGLHSWRTGFLRLTFCVQDLIIILLITLCLHYSIFRLIIMISAWISHRDNLPWSALQTVFLHLPHHLLDVCVVLADDLGYLAELRRVSIRCCPAFLSLCRVPCCAITQELSLHLVIVYCKKVNRNQPKYSLKTLIMNGLSRGEKSCLLYGALSPLEGVARPFVFAVKLLTIAWLAWTSLFKA